MTRIWTTLQRRHVFAEERRLVAFVTLVVALPFTLLAAALTASSIDAPWLFGQALIASTVVAAIQALRPLPLVVFGGLVAAQAWVVSGLVIASGGTRSPFMALFLVVVLFAAMTLPRAGFTVATAMTLAASALVVILDGRAASNVWAIWSIQAAITMAVGAAVNAQSMSRAARGRRLADSEHRFRMLAENATDGAYLLRLRPERRFDYVNPALARLAGREVEDFYRDPDVHLPMIHPDDLPIIEMSRRRGLSTPTDVRVRRGDEWGWISIVAQPIHDDTGQLVAVQGVLRDVTARRRAEDTLRAAYEQQRLAAEERRCVDEMRTGFLQAVSHEIRTPLTSIRGFTQLLSTQGSRIDAATQAQLLARLDANARRLEVLLVDMLDVAQLGVHPADAATEGTGTLAVLVDRMVKQLPTDDRDIHIDVPEEPLDVPAEHVERILRPLIENAIRHTPAGTPIAIDATIDRQRGLRLTVADRGPGVPDSEKAVIFEPFHQGAHTHHEASPGTGLGLALVSRYARMHDGHAWVVDRPGGGSAFHVELPGPGARNDHRPQRPGHAADTVLRPAPDPSPGRRATCEAAGLRTESERQSIAR